MTNIAVGQAPTDARISPDEHWAYVTSSGSNEIDVIDLTTLALARRVTLPFLVNVIQLSAAGDELFIGASTPPPSSLPTPDSCQVGVVTVSSAFVAVMDTQSLTVTRQVKAPGFIFDLVLSPDGRTLAAFAESGVLLLDVGSHATRVLTLDGTPEFLTGAFAANATKLFAFHLGVNQTGLFVFRLVDGSVAQAGPLPDGYGYGPGTVSSTPGGDRVFTEACGQECSTAVFDAGTAAAVKILPGSPQGGVLVTGDLRSAFLANGPITIDLATLQVAHAGPFIGPGVAEAFSPDQTLLFVRNFGGYPDSINFYQSPVSYDLAVFDTASLQLVGDVQLDPRQVSCSFPSPLRISPSGRLLVAPNPSLGSVSVIQVQTVSSSPCVPAAGTLCLANGRFAVTASYLTGSGQSGPAQAVPLTSDTGYFWFFAPGNVEAVVKILDGCALDNSYWVFAGGLTDVQVTINVTDTSTGRAKSYTNLLGSPFQPIEDTNALQVCP